MLGAIIQEQTDPNRGFLSNFFTADFFARSSMTNKTAILEEMVDSLRQQNIVGEGFLQSVLEREKIRLNCTRNRNSNPTSTRTNGQRNKNRYSDIR